jgi:hypothetical protein
VFDLAYDWERGTTAGQVEAAARSCGDRLHRYVFMSSIAAYGPGLDHRESDPLAPDDAPNAYVQHKASAERPTPLEAALRLGFDWYQTQPRRAAVHGFSFSVGGREPGRLTALLSGVILICNTEDSSCP